MSDWIGYAVSVNCGDPLGCYQGTILDADGNTITLNKAFRNGFPYLKPQVTLNAADIKDLRIIEEARTSPTEQTHSTVAVTKNNKKCQRATVCENLQANPSHSVTGNQQNSGSNSNKPAPPRSSIQTTTRSKPIEIQGTRNKNNHSGSYSNTGSTPKTRGGPPHERARRRNEACFGDTADPALDDDFDFEGNLALFDKQALWKEMRSAAAARPDVVRAADEAARFRHDENVLGAAPPASAIRLPDELRGPVVYTTDDGRRVPTVAPRLRRDFWVGMHRFGALAEAHTLMARAAADVALRLVGGGRRLEARNAHQAPVVVAVAGAHAVGACGAAAARLLASHGARSHVLLAGGASADEPALRREVALLAASGVSVTTRVDALPLPDVVLLATYDPLLDDLQDRYRSALEWTRSARAAVVAVEPPAEGWEGYGVNARAALLGGLPGALPPALGRVYLANVAPPAALFRDLDVHYRPPFGASAILALD